MAKTRKKGNGRFYRGTRPKKSRSGTNCHEVYCNRCYCNYQVPVETNTDVWLNRHHAHFNCKEEKKTRENLAVHQSKKRSRSSSSGSDQDRVFVLDGKTQDSGTGTCVTEMEELDIDPAVDFDIDVPDLHDRLEAQRYDELNLESDFGFFETTINADDVAQSIGHHRLDQCKFNTVHMEEIESENIDVPTADVVVPVPTIIDIQDRISTVLDVNKRSDLRSRKETVGD